jgi:hypothetical protein
MKNIIRYSMIAVSFLLVASSCEDFLKKNPTNKFNAEDFFHNEAEMELYANGMLQSYLPSFSGISLGDDSFTDICATKSGSDFYHPNLWSSQRATGWSSGDWTFVRRANYMVENINKGEELVDEAVYRHYMGVARFWRAYAMFTKVRTFGDVPWIDHVLKEDDPLLYAKRDDREYVMHNILADINYACENCSEDARFISDDRVRINRWVALAMKSKICLFEASFRRYHTHNPSTGNPWNNRYESAEDFYEECADACEQIMESGLFSIHGGDAKTAYSELFLSENVPTDEVIWARQANEALAVMHNMTVYYTSPTTGQRYSPTKDFVDMFLKLDGTPITDDRMSLTEEFINRDYRLAQNVVAPGHTWNRTSGAVELKGPAFNTVLTGYAFCKWVVENEINYSETRCNNSMPIFRLGGILLDYAEAMAELGEMNEGIWNKTVGRLRERAGVVSIYPGGAGYVKDEMLAEYYNSVSPVQISDMLLEIRRERAVELSFEWANRKWDLFRWGCGKLIAKRWNNKGWRGIWLTETEAKNGVDFNGTIYTVSTSAKASVRNYFISNSGADGTWSLSEGTHGYVIYNYALQWKDKMYVNPIPSTALDINPELGQNNGWN